MASGGTGKSGLVAFLIGLASDFIVALLMEFQDINWLRAFVTGCIAFALVWAYHKFVAETPVLSQDSDPQLNEERLRWQKFKTDSLMKIWNVAVPCIIAIIVIVGILGFVIVFNYLAEIMGST